MDAARFVTYFLIFSSCMHLSMSVCLPYHCTPTTIDAPTTKSNAPNRFRLGFIGTNYSDKTSYGMANWAAYSTNMVTSILPNTYVQLYSVFVGDTKQLASATIEMLESAKVQAVVVDLSDADIAIAGKLISNFGISVLSTTSFTGVFDSKSDFDNMFARLVTPESYQDKAVISLLGYLGATKIVYIYTNDIYGTDGYFTMNQLCVEKNITLTPFAIDPGRSLPITNAIMTARVLIIATNPLEGSILLQDLEAAGVYGTSYLYIMMYSFGRAIFNSPALIYRKILDGAVAMAPDQYTIDEVYFTTNVYGWMTANQTLFPGVRPGTLFSKAIDAVRIYADSLNLVVNAGTAAGNVTGAQIHAAMLANPHQSHTGNFRFNADGDKVGNSVVYNAHGVGYNKTIETVGVYATFEDSLNITSSLIFYNGSTQNPLTVVRLSEMCSFEICNYRGNCSDQGKCICWEGFYGLYCDALVVPPAATIDTKTTLAWAIPVGVVIMALVVCTLLYLRRRRVTLMKEIKDLQRSEINRDDIKLLDRIGRGASGEVYKASFRGTEVAVKKLLTTNASKAAIDEFMFEVAIMCGLRHPNVVLFMGSCYDAKQSEMLLVMEFHQRGSLHDVLHDPKASLSYDLLLHIACQAAQGMTFLHTSQPPLLHRDMKSHNILLDDKWNARISDFGITKFMSKGEDSSKDQNLGTIFWAAPEVLNSVPADEKSDVYSFGIVLWEIFHRQEPYVGKDVMVVALEVAGKGLRPTMSPTCPPELKTLIQSCWDADPRKRPTMAEVMDSLRTLTATHPLLSISAPIDPRTEAPSGQVLLISTEISGSNYLWDNMPRVYQQSLMIHNRLMRATMESYGGYELENHGNGFLISFGNFQSGFNWCVSTQTALMHLEWPVELLSCPQGAQMKAADGSLQWRGLRVRMSIHTGPAYGHINASSGRVTYSGSHGSKAKSLLQETPFGFIVASDEAMAEIKTFSDTLTVEPISGKTMPVNIIYPLSLASRKPLIPEQAGKATLLDVLSDSMEMRDFRLPNAMKSSADIPMSEIFAEAPLKWVVRWEDIKVKNAIGRGAVGDHYLASWKGEEVHVKVLVNQKLKEEDMIRLKGDASVLSKITHPNLASFVGVCVDKGHISILSHFEERGNLRALLSGNSSISFTQRVRIAADIAKGMDFLTNFPDPDVRIHDNFKSHNILVSKDFVAKVTDYGQSNIRDLARTMTSVGTVAWTAPEILEGEPISPMCAVYAFGIILYEIYTGKVPYDNEHPIRLVAKILSGHRPAVPADCPPAYKSLMTSCWQADPSSRPSWTIIQDELMRILS